MTGHAIHIKLDGRTYSQPTRSTDRSSPSKRTSARKLVAFYRAWRTTPLRPNC